MLNLTSSSATGPETNFSFGNQFMARELVRQTPLAQHWAVPGVVAGQGLSGAASRSSELTGCLGGRGAGAAQSHQRQRVCDAVNHGASSGGGAYVAAGTGALCSVSIPSLLAL